MAKLMALAVLLFGGAVQASPRFQNASPLERARIETGLAALAQLESGARLVDRFSGEDLVFRITSEAGTAEYSNGEIRIASPFLARLLDWQLTHVLAHELEHWRQDGMGLVRVAPLGVLELGALNVQARVWLETGTPLPSEPLDEARLWTRDLWIWLEFPWTVRAAWMARNPALEFDQSRLDGPAVRYWEAMLDEEAAWRTRWKKIMPADPKRKDRAQRFLEEASGVSLSDDLPVWLEARGREEPLPADAQPSAADQAQLSRLRR